MKKMRKVLAALLCVAMIAGVAVGCGSKDAEPKEKAKLNVVALTGPTGMGMVKLMADNEAGETAVDYSVELVGAADEITGKIVNGEVDIAAVPCNLASVLYNKTEGGVKIAAVNTLGVLYMLEANGGETIQSVADLAGKTIVTTGKGTTPEYILNYILKANGLDPESDVTIEYKSEASEVAALIQQGGAEIAMLPQPMVTTVMAKTEGVRVALDMTEEWAKAQGETGTQLVTGTIIVRSDVLENNKEAVDTFLKEYEASINYINENVTEGAELVAKYEIIPSAAIAEKAIPACNMVFMSGQDMQQSVAAYLEVLAEANPASVGGALPDENFYYLP